MRITAFKGDTGAAGPEKGMRHERFLIPVLFGCPDSGESNEGAFHSTL